MERGFNIRRFCLGFVAATFLGGAVISVPAKVFNAVDHGAVGDGAAICTGAIQKTIDAAAKAGGGTVTFPKGTYLTGALFLKSNVELRLDEGVVLRAVQDDSAYPDIWSRVAGVEMQWPAAVVNIQGQTNVSITGKGTLDGNGEFWWRKFWGEDGKSGMLKEYQARNLRWAVDYDCKRVRALLVYDSKDIKISGITILRSGFWSLTLTYCERVAVDGVIIRANVGGHGPSSDGIDIDSSRDVLVENCDIDANDDNICLKAGRDSDGLRVNRPTENVVIRNCITREGGGMLTIGSETSGGIRNVEVSGMKAIGTKVGVRFKSAKIRGGVVENIVIRDVVMEDVDRAFEMEMNWYPSYSLPVIPPEMKADEIPAHWKVLLEPVVPASRGIPEFRNIKISNVSATGARQAFVANGFSDKPIHGVRLTNVMIEAESAGKLKHAARWTMKDVVVKAADGKPLILEKCSEVDKPVILPLVARVESERQSARGGVLGDSPVATP